MFGVVHRVFGAGGPRADDQRQASANHLTGVFHQRFTLFLALRVIFARGATNDDAVNAGLDQRLQHLGKACKINAAIGCVRGNCRGVDTFKCQHDNLQGGIHDHHSLLRNPDGLRLLKICTRAGKRSMEEYFLYT